MTEIRPCESCHSKISSNRKVVRVALARVQQRLVKILSDELYIYGPPYLNRDAEAAMGAHTALSFAAKQIAIALQAEDNGLPAAKFMAALAAEKRKKHQRS